jgi:hypothetical protein
MILVEIGEVVVEEDWRTHLLWDGELEMASRVESSNTVVEDGADVDLARPLSIHGTVRTLERSADGAARHCCKVASTSTTNGSIDNAVGVVESNLLNLRARVQQQSADGSEYNSNGEEERQNSLWCEDRPVALYQHRRGD